MNRVIFMVLSAVLAVGTNSYCARGKNNSASASTTSTAPSAQSAESDELVSVLIEDVGAGTPKIEDIAITFAVDSDAVLGGTV